jgi:21S rRNA (GM2251-2'-O)-methyltransferase
MFTAGRQHEGFLLKSESREFQHIKKNKEFFDTMPKKTGNIIVLLDKVIDPQNFGAIVRTCFYYGIDYLIVNKKHRPSISPALCQISLGACENIPLYCLKNFNSFIQGKKEIIFTKLILLIEASERKWKIITTTLAKSSHSKPETILVNQLPLQSYDNALIIFGSEAGGLEGDVFSLANYNVMIPPGLDMGSINTGAYSLVESLNVGVSAGIILHTMKLKMN